MSTILALLFSSMLQAPLSSASHSYFPKGSVSDIEAGWFGSALARMKEPALPGTATGTRIYRLTVLPTWGHPVTVRLTLQGGKAIVEAKRLSGMGGYELGTLGDHRTATLSEEQAKQFSALFAKLQFANLPTQDRPGRDGSEWILEAVEDGTYRFAVRWSPGYGTSERGLSDFVAVCEWLYRASPLTGDITNKSSVEISKEP